MLVSDFDFDLPAELIAQQPLRARDGSRMLHVHRTGGGWADRSFRDFPDLLHHGDLLLLNNTRVFPARIFGRRGRTTNLSAGDSLNSLLPGHIEVLLTRQLSAEPNEWECLVRPGRKIGIGERLHFSADSEPPMEGLHAEVVGRGEFGERRIRFDPVPDFFATLDRIGHVPLPPYISRADSPQDRERYQTVYANPRGSVAAPTAGLHFTPEIFERLRQRGVETAEITLHVGLGTFQPIRVDRVEDHKIHVEPYSISAQAAAAINSARRDSRRVIAIGTTTVRALEHATGVGCGAIVPGQSLAETFIYPGYQFKIVNALLTNFHLPQSSLLMLVSAFAGKENVLRAYQHAVAERYRFYSYGDCMFIE